MKAIISLFTLTLLFGTALMAQTKFGIKAGANFGDIIENVEFNTDDFGEVDGLDYNLRINPQLGVWLDLPLTSQLSIQPELLWTQKAMQATENNPMDTYVNFHYFSLPVLAKYKLGKLSIEAGPEVSFLLDQSFRNNDGGLDESPLIDENELELAINLGIQYQHNNWIIGARASRDVTSFQDLDFTDINGEPVGSANAFHQSVMLWVGYQLK